MATVQVRGGGKRDRTADLLHAMHALSQLSYTPNEALNDIRKMHAAQVRGGVSHARGTLPRP